MRYFPVILVLVLVSCQNKADNRQRSYPQDTQNIFTGTLLADTIIYDVIIKNTDPEDAWTEKSLQGLNRQTLIDSIFDMAYQPETKVYDYFSGEALKPADIGELEKSGNFSRENVGKIQFTERWYYSSARGGLQKEVLSMVLGAEHYADSAEFRGYKPLFRIILTP